MTTSCEHLKMLTYNVNLTELPDVSLTCLLLPGQRVAHGERPG